MNIIKLTSKQVSYRKPKHLLLQGVSKMAEGDILEAMDRYAQGDESAKDDLIIGQFSTIRTIVGRFLANWPETHRFEDEMVSEGMVSVTSVIDEWSKGEIESDDFESKVWFRILDSIHVMLNDLRSIFAPSKSTNYTRVNNNQEPVYNYALRLREDIDIGVEDFSEEYVDMMDELEHLGGTDNEHLVSLIILHIKEKYGVGEEDLTDKEIKAIETLSKGVIKI